jgi:hypothetical protein
VGEKSNPASLPLDDYRAVEIFPPKGSSNGRVYTTTWYEDDGISPPPASISTFEFRYRTTDEAVEVELVKWLQPDFEPAWKELTVVLPKGDKRSVSWVGELKSS